MTTAATTPVADDAALARAIPVIDLMDGAVVRARRGDRGSYRPIVTPLAPGSDPVDIARALLARCPTPADEPPLLYVADLDALTGGAIQLDALRRLLDALPEVYLWLDAGFRDPGHAADVRHSLAEQRVQAVIASESLADACSLEALAEDDDGAHAILSLDCRLSTPMDPAGVWQRPDLWPATVIVMTLDRVGAGAGPDVRTLGQLRERAGASSAASGRVSTARRWIGAGGLRHADDLRVAAAAGAHAWLVASALHDGRLDPRAVGTR
jgi:phosphoribosylformimino-5-aminoimidazole carboxamide ribotide isomerase